MPDPCALAPATGTRTHGETSHVLVRSQWRAWAAEWGLAHRQQRSLWRRDERVTGAHLGHLVDVYWRGKHGSDLTITVRFPLGQDPSEVRARIACDPDVSAIPGWRRIRGGAEARKRECRPSARQAEWVPPDLYAFSVFESALTWRRRFPWRRPQPAGVKRWVERLIQATSRVTGPIDARCEECATGVAEGWALVHDHPRSLCGTCRERLLAEGAIDERRDDQHNALHARGVLYAAGAAVAGALAWAGFALLTRWIAPVMALGVALLVAWAYQFGAEKIDHAGRAVGAALSAAGVMLGAAIYWAWVVALERPGVGFQLDVGWSVYAQSWQKDPRIGVVSVAFALIGAHLAMLYLERLRLEPRIESPTAAPQKEGAAAKTEGRKAA